MVKHAWRYDHLTWPEIKAAIGRAPQPVVAIPIGAVEDHGAHMSISTDNDILEGVLAECGRRAEGECCRRSHLVWMSTTWISLA